MSPANIQAGFESTGIFPFNRFRLEEDLFQPSSVTDRPDPAFSENSVLIIKEIASEENKDFLQIDVSMTLDSFDIQPSSAASCILAICKESPGPSALDGASTSAETFSCTSQAVVSSYEVRPLPKAGPRTQGKGGRKKGQNPHLDRYARETGH